MERERSYCYKITMHQSRASQPPRQQMVICSSSLVDSRGRLIEILPNGTSLEIIPTGVDREIIRIFPGMGYGRSVVVFGRSMEAQDETGCPPPLNKPQRPSSGKNAERRLAEALGYMKAGEETADVVDTDTIRWVGAEFGVNCAAQLPDDAPAICTRHGTIQIWEFAGPQPIVGY